MNDTSLDPIFESVGQQYGIDPDLLRAQAMTESSLNPKAVGPVTSQGQALGVSQLMPATAASLGVSDRTDPQASIEAQAKLLKENLARYGTPEGALLAYHGGTNQSAWGPKTHDYLSKVTANYQQLKSAANVTGQSEPEPSAFEKDALNFDAAPAADKPSFQDAFAKEALAEPQVPAAKSVVASTTSSTPVQSAPSRLDLNVSELRKLQDTDPVAYKSYMDQKAAAARSEFSYGAGDVPRSIARVAAAVAPQTYSNVVGGVNDALGASLPANAADLKNALQERNATYEQQYGRDPNAGGNRLVGQLVAGAPVMGGVGKALGAAGNAVTRASPEIAQVAADIGQWVDKTPVARFLTGDVASNAVVDPVTGTIVKGSTIGNKLAQYGASGLQGAKMAVPVTTVTNAGSDAPLKKQLAQNAVGGAVLGAAVPAAYDAGTGLVNTVRNWVSGPGSVATKATGVLGQLAGESGLGNLDTTEYVPGDKPTLAQASNNPNIAALDRTLKEGSPGAGQLTTPALTDAERAQETARRTYLDSITGTPQDLENARDARSQAANLLLYGHPDGEAAAAAQKVQPSVWEQSTKPTDVTPVVSTIDKILSGPDKKNDAVISALTDIKNKLVNKDGSLESDPETLYRSVVKDINTKLEKANPLDSASQNMQAAAAQVMKVKSALNSAITDSTPGYQNYLQTYAKLSQPIDEMNVLQNKLSFLNTPSAEGIPTLSKVNSAISTITKKQGASGFGPYDSVTPETVNKLQNLQKTLARAQEPTKLLRISGSPTDPKIAAREKVDALLTSKVKPVAQWMGASAGGAGGAMLGEHLGGPWTAAIGAGLGEESGRRLGGALGDLLATDKSKVTNHLVQLLLDPSAAQDAFKAATPLVRNFGQLPYAQNALSYVAPLLATEQNQTRNLAQGR